MAVCEECGKLFDEKEALIEFEENLLIQKLNFSMSDLGILCADCAKSCILNGTSYERFRQQNTRDAAKSNK